MPSPRATTVRIARHEKVPVIRSERIDQLIAKITDWRGKTLASVRKIILDADREIIEEWKWMGSPVWSRDGIIAVGNAHKEKVKLTFAHGAKLPDPDKLFRTLELDGKTWRAIDLCEGDTVDENALKTLIRAAVAHNQAKSKKKHLQLRDRNYPHVKKHEALAFTHRLSP